MPLGRRKRNGFLEAPRNASATFEFHEGEVKLYFGGIRCRHDITARAIELGEIEIDQSAIRFHRIGFAVLILDFSSFFTPNRSGGLAALI
jgi:hypothetical protein